MVLDSFLLPVKQSVAQIMRVLILIAIPLFLNGCLTVRPLSDIKYSGGTSINSLSSNASLAYKSPERSISGSGILVYQKPDQIHMVVLSPFGSVLQEIFVSGELISIIDSGNGNAFSGNYNDLPMKGDLSAWRHIHWLIDIDTQDLKRRSAVIKRINRFGENEEAVFENGLLVSKSTKEGGEVRYGKYGAVHGVAVPFEIVYETVAKEQFIIQLDEPQINEPLTGGTFTPNLSKYTLYPLSILK
jgi:hypothetical protein